MVKRSQLIQSKRYCAFCQNLTCATTDAYIPSRGIGKETGDKKCLQILLCIFIEKAAEKVKNSFIK